MIEIYKIIALTLSFFHLLRIKWQHRLLQQQGVVLISQNYKFQIVKLFLYKFV